MAPLLPEQSERSSLPTRSTFQVEVRKSTKGNFCCCVPEACCATTADSVEALLANVKELLEDYFDDLQEDKLPFPRPVLKLPIKDEGFVCMQDVEVLLP